MMKWSFPVLHWLSTIVLAPFTAQGIKFIFGKEPHLVSDQIELYPLYLVFGFFFSLPTFGACLLCFALLEHKKIHWLVTKSILIVVTILGIFATTYLIGGTAMPEINAAYSVTVIITGLLIPISINKNLKKSHFGQQEHDNSNQIKDPGMQ